MSEGSSGPFREAKRATTRPPFSIILSITLTGIMGNVLVTPVAPDIAAEFGEGTSGVGLLLAAATAPGVLLAPVIGVLADRYGRRAVVVPCLALFGIAGGLGGFAPTFATLVALRFLQGCGAAGLVNLAVVIVGDHWDGADRARMLGRNAAALTASIAVLPPLGGALAELWGWRATFAPYWIGVGTAIAALVFLPPSVRGDGTLRQQLQRTRPYLAHPTVIASTAMAFVLFVIIFGLFLTVLPVYLRDDFGVGAGGRGLILAAPSVTSTAMALSLGRFRARFGAPRLLVAGSVMLAAGVAILAVAPNLPILVLGPVVYGFGEGLLIPTLQDVVSGVPPQSSRGAVVALFVGVTRLGQTVGPVGSGAALSVVSATTVFWVGAVASALLAAGQPFVRGRVRARQELAAPVTN